MRAIAATALVLLCALPRTSRAGDHYALIVTGASGGDPYAGRYDGWRTSFVRTLREKCGYSGDRIIVLAEQEAEGVGKATRENVKRVLGDLQRRLRGDDQLLVLLIGHGTALDEDDAKFNLVGPDLRASEWADLFKPIAARIVFVDTTSGSFPFLRRLAGRRRIVVTATDSAAQRFETVFPEFFLKAFDDVSADADKDGRVSIWEAFSYASAHVRRWYEDRGQLPTERALLDDTGAGIGREARNAGADTGRAAADRRRAGADSGREPLNAGTDDGGLARRTYLDQPAASAATGAATPGSTPIERRTRLEAALEALKARKTTMPAEEYQAQLEKILVELARISRQLRSGT
jgi:hypothetical protein